MLSVNVHCIYEVITKKSEIKLVTRQFSNAMIIFFRYFIFTSFWQYKIYYVFGFMLLVYFILVIVTVCVTIVSSYFLLNAEDYRWYVNTHSVYNKHVIW